MRLWGRRKSEGDAAAGDESHATDDKLVVKHDDPDYFYNLQYTCKIDHSPDDVYRLLTHPVDSATLFRNVTQLYRTVLADDKKGRRRLALGMRANIRILIFRMHADMHTHVEEDDSARTIRSSLVRSSNMQRFKTGFTIGPYPATASAPAASASLAPPGDAWSTQVAAASAGLRRLFAPGSLSPVTAAPTDTLMVYEEAALPKGHIPELLRGMVQGFCAKQARRIVGDLRGELDRRRDARLQLESGGAKAAAQSQGRRGRAHEHKGESLGLAAPAACLSASPLPAAVARGLAALWEATEPLCIHLHVTLGEQAAA